MRSNPASEADSGVNTPEVAAALRHVAVLAVGPPLELGLRVTLHFHPDRPFAGRPLLEHLAADQVYRSQFETLTSNGGLTAHPGGDRWNWEQRIFGGAYDHSPPSSRPKYGSLNHRRRQAGGSIRFGSAHLRLAQRTLIRSTFCYPDSVYDPTAFGDSQHMGLAPLAGADHRDLLDDYIEAHVHGPLHLGRDVEALVLDPAYRGTRIEAVAATFPFPTEWHQGFRLHIDELARHPNYRGQAIVDAARSSAEQGWLDARIIGAAIRSGAYDDQTLKRVWHCTARFGHPA